MSVLFTTPDGREKVFFGFDWQFALTDSTDFPPCDTPWRSVQLPHDWSVDYPVTQEAASCGSGGYARTGIGWYRRTFTLAPEPGFRYALVFDGVYMNCDVWLNGQHVGGHVYGYTGFEQEITSALCAGENELLVRVNNSRQPGSRWYSGSGITREVHLLRTRPIRLRTWGIAITTPEITDESALVCLKADVLGAFGRPGLTLETDILGPDGQLAASASCDLAPIAQLTAQLEFSLPCPARWDIDSPALYTAVTRLMENGLKIDEVRTRFGVREIEYNTENGFLLNGRKVIMQGVCLHHDGGCVGAAVPPAIWQRRLRKLKAMGCNALRCSHNPPDPALLDLADEMGFVVMDEAFDEWRHMKGKAFGSNTHSSKGYSEWFDACAAEDMTAMVERDRNHPCVVMWSIGNEVPEQSREDGWRTARMLAGLCHAIDPTRPITQACDQMKAEPFPATEAFLNELDIVGVNYVDRWRERTETFFDEEKREHPDWLLLGTEDIAVNGPRADYEMSNTASVWGPKSYYAKMLKAEKLWKFIRTRPYVIGTFMWTGVDYLGECFWPHKGSSAGVMDTCGFEKDGWHFYRSQWVKDEPGLHLFPHRNLPLQPGTVYPLVCYTNCASVELLVDGVSYGVKAYEFPNQGMTQQWAHFDRPFAPITTNDLHLTWDVPFGPGKVVAIGRDLEGHEIARQELSPAGTPVCMDVQADCTALPADGRSVVQLEIALKDAQGLVVPDHDLPVTLTVEGGELLGMDNGKTDDQTAYRAGWRNTYGGLAYAVIRAPRLPGCMRIRLSAPGLSDVTLCLDVG